MKKIQQYLKKSSIDLDNIVIYALNHLGQQCIRVAKNLNTYQVQTGNLKNSIGYVIFKNGVLVDSVFEAGERGHKFTAESEKGEEVGEQYAKSLAVNFANTPYALVVVAGMHYASYVENVHGKDVLNPAKIHAIDQKDRIIESIIRELERKMM